MPLGSGVRGGYFAPCSLGMLLYNLELAEVCNGDAVIIIVMLVENFIKIAIV